MRVWSGTLAVGIATLVAATLTAQEPGGYYRATMPPLPDSLREVRSGGRFTLSVLRVAADTAERRLIEYAESLIPPKDSIESAARTVTGARNIASLEDASHLPGPRWWWRDWDGVLLPFALTGAAVDQYITRIRAFSTQPNRFGPRNPPSGHRASLAYSARVTRPADRPGHIEVHLSVSFGYFCGPLCALSFRHSRTVEFDANGRVVRVLGDAVPSVTVS